MKTSIYEYSDYKSFVIDLIDKSEGKVRGRRRAIAKHIGCHVSHITLVLKGNGHFSLEQAESIARFFGLNEQETDFLFLLIKLLLLHLLC